MEVILYTSRACNYILCLFLAYLTFSFIFDETSKWSSEVNQNYFMRQHCFEDYKSNKCDELNLPVMVDPCFKWLACSEREVFESHRFATFSSVIGAILDRSISSLSLWSLSVVFGLFLLFRIIVFFNHMKNQSRDEKKWIFIFCSCSLSLILGWGLFVFTEDIQNRIALDSSLGDERRAICGKHFDINKCSDLELLSRNSVLKQRCAEWITCANDFSQRTSQSVIVSSVALEGLEGFMSSISSYTLFVVVGLIFLQITPTLLYHSVKAWLVSAKLLRNATPFIISKQKVKKLK
eukprot:GDKJ01022722.1.p1 GENE.GDKJ01022722.1~~GDKJ01022722.1.p1  ORF type:complete len:293 (+),score=18.67 GDKJ01022722.1:25-903(+)